MDVSICVAGVVGGDVVYVVVCCFVDGVAGVAGVDTGVVRVGVVDVGGGCVFDARC